MVIAKRTITAALIILIILTPFQTASAVDTGLTVLDYAAYDGYYYVYVQGDYAAGSVNTNLNNTQGAALVGTTVILTATAYSGYVFDYWEVLMGNAAIYGLYSSTTSFIMPPENVSIRAVFRQVDYSGSVAVSTNNSLWGTASASMSTAAQGTTVYLTATAKSGYAFDYWEVLSGNTVIYDIISASTSFIMPSGYVSVRAVFRQAGYNNSLSVSVNNSSWGTAGANSYTAAQGTTVYLTATARSGYAFDYWEVLSGNAVIYDSYSSGTSFIMPSGSVSVRAYFQPDSGYYYDSEYVYLEDGIKASRLTGLSGYPASGSFVMGGITYYKGISGTGSGYSGTSGTAVYNIEGRQFTRLLGTFGIRNTTTSTNNSGTITIIGDGQYIAVHQAYVNDSLISIDVNIPQNVKELQVRIQSSNGTYGFGNAYFIRNYQSLSPSQTYTISATTVAGGSVSGGGSYQYGETATLYATPSGGYTLEGWYEGNLRVSTNPTYMFIVKSSKTLEARFVQTQDLVISNNHSSWAEKELIRVLTLNLIPDSLKNSGIDYTKPVTRAEFAGIAVKAYEGFTGTTAVSSVNKTFTDTSDMNVLKAYNMGLMVGVTSERFDPDALINREQAAAVLTRVYKKATISGWSLASDAKYPLKYTQIQSFADDASISAWAKESVYFMAANGIILGSDNNKFAPRAVTSAEISSGYATATREQALIMALRLIDNLK